MPLNYEKTLDFQEVRSWIENLKNILGDEYTIVASPFEMNAVDGYTKIIAIDGKEYSYNEINAALENS